MKYCAFLFSAMMASASAFAPSSKVPTTTALNQAIDYNPNLGGPTSSDPVDQTLMNMVRAQSELRMIFSQTICRSWQLFVKKLFISPLAHAILIRLSDVICPDASNSLSSQPTSQCVRCKEEAPFVPGISLQRPSVFPTTFAPMDDL